MDSADAFAYGGWVESVASALGPTNGQLTGRTQARACKSFRAQRGVSRIDLRVELTATGRRADRSVRGSASVVQCPIERRKHRRAEPARVLMPDGTYRDPLPFCGKDEREWTEEERRQDRAFVEEIRAMRRSMSEAT